jgi:septal ring-binding cell division protein DamX
MERNNGLQLELFTPSGDSGTLKPRPINNSFFSYIRAWEKTILIIIGIAVTSIISFSFGVEKGKRVVTQKNSVNFDVALKQQSGLKAPAAVPSAAKPIAPMAPVIENKNSIAPPPLKSTIESYTIQVASYKTKAYAQKEADNLKKQGFVTLILTKGNYIVLCVGNFNSKKTAQSFVTQLKKRYQDCSIRRL